MDKLKKFVGSIVDLNEAEWLFFKEHCKVATFKKGDNLNFLARRPRQMAFILSGVVRSCLVEEDGRDFTWNFHFYSSKANINNLFVGDYAGFLMDRDSQFQFEVTQDCRLAFIQFEDLKSLYGTNEKWERYGRLITEQAYVIIRDRALTLLSKSASERLALLERDFPDIFEKVPNYHIASYLGITPQTLSRLQAESRKI